MQALACRRWRTGCRAWQSRSYLPLLPSRMVRHALAHSLTVQRACRLLWPAAIVGPAQPYASNPRQARALTAAGGQTQQLAGLLLGIQRGMVVERLYVAARLPSLTVCSIRGVLACAWPVRMRSTILRCQRPGGLPRGRSATFPGQALADAVCAQQAGWEATDAPLAAWLPQWQERVLQTCQREAGWTATVLPELPALLPALLRAGLGEAAGKMRLRLPQELEGALLLQPSQEPMKHILLSRCGRLSWVAAGSLLEKAAGLWQAACGGSTAAAQACGVAVEHGSLHTMAARRQAAEAERRCLGRRSGTAPPGQPVQQRHALHGRPAVPPAGPGACRASQPGLHALPAPACGHGQVRLAAVLAGQLRLCSAEQAGPASFCLKSQHLLPVLCSTTMPATPLHRQDSRVRTQLLRLQWLAAQVC